MPRLARAFVMGALLFPLLDGFHTHFDVLAYAHPAVCRMAWWVPLNFGAVWVIVALALPGLENLVGAHHPLPAPSRDRLLGELGLFAGIYAATGVFAHAGSAPLAVVLYLAAAARLVFAAEPGDYAFVLAGALLGPLGEAVTAATGVFHYVHPDFLGIPAWLPALWAHGGFFARATMRAPWFYQPPPR